MVLPNIYRILLFCNKIKVLCSHIGTTLKVNFTSRNYRMSSCPALMERPGASSNHNISTAESASVFKVIVGLSEVSTNQIILPRQD